MKRLQSLGERFDALTLRERIILGVAALLIVAVLWMEFINAPQNQANSQLQRELQTTDTQIATLNQQMVALSNDMGRDPDEANRRQLENLQAELAQVEARLQDRTASMISPTQMAQVLETVLTQKTDLTLIGVRNLPIEPLLQSQGQPEKESKPAGVYRHGMEIEFRGSYLSTLEYLKALQELEWDFFWDGLQLQVEQYPASTITIRVYTLSLKEGWIGV